MSEYKQGNEIVSHRVIKSVDEDYEYSLDLWEERIYQQGRVDREKEVLCYLVDNGYIKYGFSAEYLAEMLKENK